MHINSENFRYYINSLDRLNDDELEILEAAIRSCFIEEKNEAGKITRKITFISRNGNHYDNFDDCIEANKRYCNAITTIKSDDESEYYSFEDVLDADRDFWKDFQLEIVDDDILSTLGYYMYFLDESNEKDIKVINFMFKFINVVADENGNKKLCLIEKGNKEKSNRFSSLTEFIDFTKKYTNAINSIKADNGKDYFSWREIIELNRKYWNNLSFKIENSYSNKKK